MKVNYLSAAIVSVVFTVAALGVSSPANATGVPVVDAALNTQTAANQAANIAKYIEQVAQLKSQLDQMKQQYESITGTRNLGEILNNRRSRTICRRNGRTCTPRYRTAVTRA